MEIISSSPRNIQEKELLHNPKASPTPPQTPRSQDSTINNTSYPTTFVQADTSNFKQVVQLLTGTSTRAAAAAAAIPPIKTTPHKKQGFKLHERRNSLKNGLMVNTLFGPKSSQGFSPKVQTDLLLSPSILDFPSLALSPITPPLVGEKNKAHKPSSAETNLPLLEGEGGDEEERAIAEKKFYLHHHHHPSPRSKDVEPKLLTLFPLTSPRVSASPASSSSTTATTS